jgi:hypothetical protein
MNQLKNKVANSATSKNSHHHYVDKNFNYAAWVDDIQAKLTSGYYNSPSTKSPPDTGTLTYSPTAILDTGANSTYVTHRRFLTDITAPASPSVTVADGTVHPILASGMLVGYPDITADLVPSFSHNLIGVSHIINNGATRIIRNNKFLIIENTDAVNKLMDFVLKVSHKDNLIILMGTTVNNLYTMDLLSTKHAHLFINSHHFSSINNMVYYFYLFFNCPGIDAYCRLIDSKAITGLPASLTSKVIRKYYPYHDPIKAKSQLSKRAIPNKLDKEYNLSRCGELVELDILMVSTPTFNIPKAQGGFKHVVLVVDVYSSYLTYVPIKSMSKPQRFIASVITKFQDSGHPIKHKWTLSFINLMSQLTWTPSM